MTTVDEEATIECAVCLTDTNVDDAVTTVDDEQVCMDCCRVCERCDDTHSINDDFEMVDDSMWCDNCASIAANYCDGCDIRTTMHTARLQDRREYWCESCLDRAYYCEGCDGYYADGCDNGCDDDEDEPRVIHDYSYRPDAIFHSTNKDERLYFGIEIEVEARGNLGDAANYAHRLEGMELAYLKHDGSLQCGFEVVTHPMSHDFYKNQAQDFWTVIEGLRTDYKVKSWDTKTCGLHIHVSRTGFTNGSHMHRFLNLVYSNQELYEALAGRSSDQWAKFSDIIRTDYARDIEGNRIVDEYNSYSIKTTRSFMRKLNSDYGSDRYSAVNTLNRETLEMRIFRGTVNSNTIKAHLDLAHASVEYTRVMSVPQVRDGALSPSNFVAYIKANEALYPELVARLAKIWNPTLSASRQEVSI